MKKLIVIFFLFFGFNALAGGFRFPDVPFSYAKLYLFNLNLEQPSDMDFRIYDNGIYAQSKLGNGWLLPPSFHANMESTFAQGIDELVVGLSKCYMPRHGIIYYDSNHNPVASLSICFECEKISVWRKETIQFSDDYTTFDYKKAEKQIEDLAKLIQAEKIPVYKNEADEKKYFAAFASDTNFFKARAQLVHVKKELDQFPLTITSETIKTWASSKNNFSKGLDTTNTRTGQKFTRLNYSKNSHFLFHNETLHFAHFTEPSVILPNGVSVGMSVEEVLQKMGYDLPENGIYPTRLNLIGGNWNIQFEFEYQTLVGIMLHPGK